MESSPVLHAPEPSPRQFVNDLLGQAALERGDALAPHRPLELHLQLTSGCNLDCYMCHEHLRPENARHGRGLRVLSPELLELVEREILPYSSRLHLGVGGEPMLAPNFLELIERAHARSQRIHLTTNATRIATDRVAEVLARCVTTIEVSADGATAETYERVRGGASFARLLQNLELFNRHRLLYPAGERAKLTLCFVLMRSNTHELPLFVELAGRLSADGVSAWPVIPVTDEGRSDVFDARHAAPFLALARKRASESGIALDLPFDPEAGAAPEPRNARSEALRHLGELESRANTPGSPAQAGRRVYCHMPTVALYVFWDGRVYPCANPAAHQGPPLGHLGQQSFEEIWNGRALRNLRAGLASGDAPEICRRCPILHRTAAADPGANGNGAVSDLVSWFGDRDLATQPAGWRAGALVDDAVASGLAAHAHKRWTTLARYSRGLEQTARKYSPERWAALESERDQLVQHATVLESERDQLVQHAMVLEGEREHLVRHLANLERILRRIRGRPMYRMLSRIKDLFITPRPRPPTPYVPPWVADGTRKPGEPVARVLPRSSGARPAGDQKGSPR